MHLIFPLPIVVVLALVLAGCESSPVRLPRPGVPFVHKIDVQQGNVVSQEMVAQLRAGMNKKKVRFVMGTPIIQDTFHAKRWDYIYTFHEGGGGTERRLVTVIFDDDDKLVAVEGDVKAALGRLEVDLHQDMSVQVPGEYEKSFLGKVADSMPFIGDDEPEEADAESDDDAADDALAESPDDSRDDEDDEAAFDEDEDDLELVAEADATSVTVPEDAPPEKKKGFFKRLVDSVGLGADEDEDDDEADYDPGDPKYRDPSDPDNQIRPY